MTPPTPSEIAAAQAIFDATQPWHFQSAFHPFAVWHPLVQRGFLDIVRARS